MAGDVAVVRSGRVEQVLRSVRGARVPHGAMGINCEAGRVHPGMLYDGASHTFHPPPVDTTQPPAASSSISVVQHAPAGSAAQPTPVMGGGGSPSSNQNVITLNVAAPAAPVTVESGRQQPAPAVTHHHQYAPVQAGTIIDNPPQPSREPAVSPRLDSAAPQMTRSSMAPESARSAIDRVMHVRDRLRAIQFDLWPPEREAIADLASVYVAYGDQELVPELVAMLQPGFTLSEIAGVALEARALAQERIAEIGRLLTTHMHTVTDDASADALIAQAHRIATGDI